MCNGTFGKTHGSCTCLCTTTMTADKEIALLEEHREIVLSQLRGIETRIAVLKSARVP